MWPDGHEFAWKADFEVRTHFVKRNIQVFKKTTGFNVLKNRFHISECARSNENMQRIQNMVGCA